MYCSGCGQALVTGQEFCPKCGRKHGVGEPRLRAAQNVSPGAPQPGYWAGAGAYQLAALERKVNVLGTAWLVYAALSAMAAAAAYLFFRGMGGGHNFLAPWTGHGWGHRFGFATPFWLRFAGAAAAFRVGLAVAAGVGLLQKTSWGRWIAVVAAVISLLHFPLGTALAIWTLVLLLKSPNAALYEAMAR